MVIAKPGSGNPLIKNSKLRFISLKKKKVDVTHHSITDIVLNSISEQLM